MSFTIGNVALPVEPLFWQSNNSQVTIRGGFTGASVAAGLILREQLLGYTANPDEPLVPIISSVDPRINGFYRITNVDLLTDPVTVLQGHLDYTIQATRMVATPSGLIESMITGALMVNALGITTTAEPFHAETDGFEYGINVTGYTTETRYLADGSGAGGGFGYLTWVRMNPSAAPVYKALAKWSLRPEFYYHGACVLSSSLGGAHTVVGQREAVRTDQWTISNGLVKLTWPSGIMTLLWGDSTQTYRTTASMTLRGAAGGAGALSTFAGSFFPNIRIIRNAPEEVIIRVPLSPLNAGAWSPLYVDVGIRRGSRIVRFYLVATANDTWALNNSSTVASTAITGGNVWTANDGFGNRVGIFSSVATTNDLVNGKITANAAASTFDCGIAGEIGGTGSTNRDTIASQVLQYVGGAGGSQAERAQIVAR